MGPIGFPETSVRHYNCSLRKDLEERSFQLLSGGSLTLRKPHYRKEYTKTTSL